MAKWARVVGGVVYEVIASDPTGKYHPSIPWIPCGNTVVAGMLYENGVFANAPLTTNRAKLICGPLQLRKALRAAGLYELARAYVAGADEETQEAWEYASEFKRLDPFILAAQSALNKTDEEVDALFQLALTF